MLHCRRNGRTGFHLSSPRFSVRIFGQLTRKRSIMIFSAEVRKPKRGTRPCRIRNATLKSTMISRGTLIFHPVRFRALHMTCLIVWRICIFSGEGRKTECTSFRAWKATSRLHQPPAFPLIVFGPGPKTGFPVCYVRMFRRERLSFVLKWLIILICFSIDHNAQNKHNFVWATQILL